MQTSHTLRAPRPLTLTWLAALALLAVLVGNPLARGAKKAPPPPPEAGTVFFRLSDGHVYGMKADGAGLTKVLDFADIVAEVAYWSYTGPDVVPSSRTYDGQHWWLWMGPREDGVMHPGTAGPILEFFVGIPGLSKMRLTNLWEDYRIVPSTYPQISWSNDHADAFFSFMGREQIYNLKTETWSNGPINVYKIPFQVTADPETGAPLPAPAIEPAVDATGTPLLDGDGNVVFRTAIEAVVPQPGWNDDAFSWSPDGSTLLYRGFEETFSETGSQQFRVMLLRHTAAGVEAPYALADGSFVMAVPADPAPVLVWEDDRLTGALTGPQKLAAQWSPDGGRIAFARFNGASSVGRDILTIPGDAAGLIGLQGTTTVLTGKNLGYSQPFWSPATGAQIVACEVDARKGIDVSRWPRNLVRVQSTGGPTVKLTGSLDPLAEKTTLAWRLGLPWAVD